MTTRPEPDLAATLTRFAAPGVPDAELLRRFTDTRDEAAFELLVWRHGGMVLGTCRRVLGRSADAEDAFQATFLALARRAASVRCSASLPGWLHRVALRAALRLRAGPRPALPLPDVAAPVAPLPDDTAVVLDEEIGRLPDKLRIAFVLCELEGLTDSEAAVQLGCPKGTVLSRLARARARLRARLTRRGLALAATGALVGRPAVLGAARVAATARGAVSFITGRAEGAASARAVALARSALRAAARDARRPVVAVLAVVVLGAGAALAARGRVDDAPPPVPPAGDPSALVAAPVPRAPARYTLATADHEARAVDEVRFSPDGKWIVTAGMRKRADLVPCTVAVWEAGTGKYVRALTEAAGQKPDRNEGLYGITAEIEFSPDGALCAVVKPDEPVVTLWSVGTWKPFAVLPHSYVTGVQFAPNSRFVATWSWNAEMNGTPKGTGSALKVWSATTGKPVFEEVLKEDYRFAWAAFAPNSATLAAATSTGVVRVFHTTTGKVQSEIRTPDRMDTVARFSPDGTKLFTWTTSTPIKGGGVGMRAVRVWDLATGQVGPEFEDRVEPSHISSLLFGHPHKTAHARDGARVAAVGTDETVWVWDAATGKRLASIKFGMDESGGLIGSAERISFAPDGSILAVSGRKFRSSQPSLSTSGLYAVVGGRELVRLPGARRVVFADDGKTVAVVTAPPDPEGGPDEVTVCGLADLPKIQRLKEQ
jgi:DNA-directed RNA polymerase specialized sigma24 family protein/WD40 repeat protein